MDNTDHSRKAFTIRAVRESDVEVFRQLRLEALRSHPEAFGSDHDESAALPTSHWLERIRQADGNGNGLTCVAESDAGALVGMTGVVRDTGIKVAHNAFVWGVYVQPDWRGLGIGRELLNTCIKWAADRSVLFIRLAAVTTNTRAIQCYARAGFETYGLQPQVIRANGRVYDELLMCKRLSRPVQ